jgi:hypothetical protein
MPHETAFQCAGVDIVTWLFAMGEEIIICYVHRLNLTAAAPPTPRPRLAK